MDIPIWINATVTILRPTPLPIAIGAAQFDLRLYISSDPNLYTGQLIRQTGFLLPQCGSRMWDLGLQNDSYYVHNIEIQEILTCCFSMTLDLLAKIMSQIYISVDITR